MFEKYAEIHYQIVEIVLRKLANRLVSHLIHYLAKRARPAGAVTQLAPIIPMATYRIYNDLYGGDIHTEEFPKAGKEFLASFTISDLSELNSTIWKAKKDKQLSLKSPIKSLTISNKFFQAEKDMIAAHNTEKIEYGDETEVEL